MVAYLNLMCRTSSNITHGPGCFFLDVILLVEEQLVEVCQGSLADDGLGLLVVTLGGYQLEYIPLHKSQYIAHKCKYIT